MVPRSLKRKKRVKAHLADGWYGVTVSYCDCFRKLYTSRVGYGKTFKEALRDADSQLSDGVWIRLVVSHPASVYQSLQATQAARFARSTMHRGENVTIRVEKRISEELPGA